MCLDRKLGRLCISVVFFGLYFSHYCSMCFRTLVFAHAQKVILYQTVQEWSTLRNMVTLPQCQIHLEQMASMPSITGMEPKTLLSGRKKCFDSIFEIEATLIPYNSLI